MMTTVFQVALGGACGATLRYGTGVAMLRLLGPGFPAATLFVNVAGSFAMGVLAILFAHKGLNAWFPLAMTGFLGGFTTFSAFSLDAYTLFERGQMTVAALYVLASVGLSLLALVAGAALARGIWA